MRVQILGLASVFGLISAACGGASSGGLAGPDGGAAGASAVSSNAACAAVSKARCEKRDSCTNGIANQVKYGTEAVCESRDTASCTTGLAASGTGATPTTVEGCAAALPGQDCADFLGGVIAAACMPQTGLGASGAACVADAQCASAYCAVPTNGACGTCAPTPKAGDSCAATGTCGTGLGCTTDTSVCVALVAQGGTCGKGNPCASGLSCVGEAKLNNNTCQPIGASVGTACDPTERTAAACDRTLGLFCRAATMKCDSATLAGPGEPCAVVATGFAICNGGGTCELPNATAVTGTCAAPPADGAPCDPGKADQCLAPARCVVTTGTTGTCRTPDPTSCK